MNIQVLSKKIKVNFIIPAIAIWMGGISSTSILGNFCACIGLIGIIKEVLMYVSKIKRDLI